MNIVYLGKMPLHVHSGRSELVSALATSGYNAFYVSPLRMKDYIKHCLGLLRYDADFSKLHYHPFWRISRKCRDYETNCFIKILQNNKLINNQTFVLFNDIDIGGHLRDILPSSITVIYHIYDRYSEHGHLRQADKQSFDLREKEVIKTVDGVLCVSKKLLIETQQINNKSFWFPGAVRADQIIDLQTSKKTTLKIGIISKSLKRLDWDLICKIATNLPEFIVEIIGENDLENSRIYPDNIHFIGQIPFTKIPQYVNRWHVGLALYEKNRFNDYCCPLKYFEYSSLNVPTISTTIPEGITFAQLYPEIITLADNADRIAEHVRRIVRHENRGDYTRLAKENNWLVRADQLVEILKSIKKYD